MTRGHAVRNDKTRRLLARAAELGWVATVDGQGHVRVEHPATGMRFLVSTTARGGRMSHDYENTRSAARKAGLDVSGL